MEEKHNMSNQFYNVLIEFLAQYFMKASNNSGKFYLETENQKQTQQFYETCKVSKYAQTFSYKHPQGTIVYETVELDFGRQKLVIAATVNDVTSDFLVTLRNLISEEAHAYPNTAILFVCHEHLASIADGSADITAKSEALHYDVFSNYFDKRYEELNLTNTEKVVVKSYLNRKRKEQQFSRVSFFDYQDILEVINDGKISPEEYHRLGFFCEDNLEPLKTERRMLQRLEENHQTFEKLQNAYQYNYYEKASSEEFFEKDAKKVEKMLKNPESNWELHNFDQIMQFRDAWKTNKKVTLKQDGSVNYTNFTCEPLIRFQSDTAAGKRNYHIIAIVEDSESDAVIEFEFNEKLKKDGLEIYKQSVIQEFSLDNRKIKLVFKPSQHASFEKIIYKHDEKASTRYTFQILLLPAKTPVNFFENVKTMFLLDIDKKKQKCKVKIRNEENHIVFGSNQGATEYRLDESTTNVMMTTSNACINIEDVEGDNVEFILQYKNIELPILIEEMKKMVRPLSGDKVWQLPRINQMSFEISRNEDKKITKLVIGTTENNVDPKHQKFFEYESYLIEHGCLQVEVAQEELCHTQLPLPQKVKTAYHQLTQAFKNCQTIPSLAYWDDSIVNKAKEYLITIAEVIQQQTAGSYLSDEVKNIIELGIVLENESVCFTPLHPLMVAFHLEALNQLGKEEVAKEVLIRLLPSGLLSLFEYHGNIYKATNEVDLHQWSIYKQQQVQTIGETNQILDKIVLDKMEQFYHHFSFLFEFDQAANFRINVVNITSDAQIFKGVLEYMMRFFKRKGHMPQIDVTIYQHESCESYFEKFSYVTTVNQLNTMINDFSVETEVYDEQEVLRMLQQHLSYRKYTEFEDNIQYAHISFYKMNDKQEVVKDHMSNQKTGYALSGLLNGATTDERDNGHNYFGAGTKYITSDKSQLVTFANQYNELVANLFQSSNQPYQKDIAIMTNVKTEAENKWMQFLDNSLWMVFVEPDVELEFFMHQPKIEIIHYSDQLTSTTKYDAITITSQIVQYKQLLGTHFKITDTDDVHNLLHSFNSLNGDWLLKLFGLSMENGSVKEKMSIVSAAKMHTGYLTACSSVTWIPISLEEIIRVSGAIGLNKSSIAAPFTTHNLGKKGQHSDDLLFIGFGIEDQKVIVYFHVCEVKQGSSDQKNKAYEQLKNTIAILAEYVVNNKSEFAMQFYRNFFVQQALATYNKLKTYGLYQTQLSELEWETILTAIHDGEYETKFFEIPGIHIHFDTETLTRQQVKLGYTLDGELPIYMFKYYGGDADIVLTKNFIEVTDNMKQNKFELLTKVENLEHSQVNPIIVDTELDGLDDLIISNFIEISDHENSKITMNDSVETRQQEQEIKKLLEPIELEGFEINELNDKSVFKLLPQEISVGTFGNSLSTAKIGYLSPEINNKHMLVIGKSGSGKTYFIQRMLDEIAKRNISSLIIDYTRGFLPEHLDDDFIRRNNDKINQYFVVNDKCPINPFKKYSQKISGLEIKETGVNVGNRIKSIFNYASSSLGPQQLNDIYTVAKDGVNQKDEQFTMNDFAEGLKERNMSAYTQFQSFFDSDLFANESIDWDEIFDNSGKITIIQLAPYDKGIQKILTEFILWDLWHYALAKGEVSKSLPIILDEAQNLDWNEQSPSYKFLTEGRKFGVAAWFATQSYAQLSKIGSIIGDNAATKVYFSVADTEIKEVAKRIKNKSLDESTRMLQKLTKGEAVMDTLFLDRENQPKLSTEVIKVSAFNSES